MLADIPIADFAPETLLGIVVILILIGRLVPLTALRDAQKQGADWKAAYERERSAREAAEDQTKELLEVGKTTQKLIEALFQNSKAVAERSGDQHALAQDK